MHRGYTLNYRKSVDHPLYSHPKIWHYFDYCQKRANWEPTTFVWNKLEITLERGEFVSGMDQDSKVTGLSIRSIRTARETLVNLGMIEIVTGKTTNRYTVLKVCNYDIYNDEKTHHDRVNDRQATGKRQASDSIEELIRIEKNKKEVINAPKSSLRKKVKKPKPVRDNPPEFIATCEYCDEQQFEQAYIDPKQLWDFYVTDRDDNSKWTYKDGKPVVNWKSLYRNIHDKNKREGKVVSNNYVQDQSQSHVMPAKVYPANRHPDDPIARHPDFAPVEEVVFGEPNRLTSNKPVFVRRGEDWFDHCDGHIRPGVIGHEEYPEYDCIKRAILKT